MSTGTTITDAGSLAAGAGFSPISRVALVFNVERTHIASRTSHDGDVISSFRGMVAVAPVRAGLAWRF